MTLTRSSSESMVSTLLVFIGCCLLSLTPTSAQTPSNPPVDAAPTLTPVAATIPTEPPAGTTTAPTIPGWQGCNDPNLGFQPVTIGQPTTICLVLSGSPDWSTPVTYMRLNFQPMADTYSRFHVPDSFQQLVSNQQDALSNIFPGNITVHAASQTVYVLYACDSVFETMLHSLASSFLTDFLSLIDFCQSIQFVIPEAIL